MPEHELKAEFAKLLLKISDPFKAALELFPDNTARALRVANEWPTDPEVIASEKNLVEKDGELSFLPTKAEFAKKLWQKMHEDRVSYEEYAKLGKLYADIRGFIEKPQTTINNNNLTNNRVMIVCENGSDLQWEAKLRKQQDSLINVESEN